MLEVVELRDIGIQTKIFSLLQRSTSAKLVEDVVVAFCQGLEDDTRALEKVCPDASPDNLLLAVKENLK